MATISCQNDQTGKDLTILIFVWHRGCRTGRKVLAVKGLIRKCSHFYRLSVFAVKLLVRDATEATSMAIFVISDLKSTRNDVLFFVSRKLLILTVIFAILVGHIGLKKLTENADLQSQTMS